VATDSIAATVPIAGTIASIAVNPSTNELYAIVSGALISFDGTTLSQIVAIPNIENGALVVNAANNKIYAGSTGGSFAVAVVDGSRDRVSAIANLPNDPYDLIVDPVTNNVYTKPNATASIPDLAVYKIDGSSNLLAATIGSPFSPTVGFGPNFDFADAVNNKIYSGPVVIAGASDATAQGLPAFDFPLNSPPPVTCRSSRGLATDFSLCNMYTGCDGALLIADTITGSVKQMVPVNFMTFWTHIIANPSTHAVYGINQSTVAIVDPIALTVNIVSLGDLPGGLAANPVTNRVYIVDQSLNATVTVNGATNLIASKTFAQIGALFNAAFLPQVPFAIAVNKAKNQYVVISGGSGMVYDGATNAPLVAIHPQFSNTGAAIFGILFPSVNELTNQLYTTNNQAIFVTDLSTGARRTLALPQTKIGEICTFRGMAINAAQNQVYASAVCQSASPTLFVFDGASGALIQNVDLGASIPFGSDVGDVLYNPKSNKLYIANFGGFNALTGTGTGPSTEVYSATTFTHLASIPNVIGPLAVDTVLNAIYGLSNSRANTGDGNAGAVIDGNTDTLIGTFPLGFVIDTLQPVPIVANEATGMVYFANNTGGSVSVFQGNLPSPGVFTVSGQFSGAGAAGVTITAKGGVTATAVAGPNGTFTLAGLPPGVYSIVPSAPGVFFSPASTSVNITTANITGVSFAALTTPVAITNMTLAPFTTVASGVSTSATVTINQVAPAGGIVLALSSTNTKLIKVPASVTIPSGRSSAAFSIQPSGTNVVTPITVTSSYSGSLATQASSASVVLTVSPGDTVHIKSATYSKASQLLTVTASSTNAAAILQVFLASGNQLAGTMINQGGGNFSIQLPLVSGTQASIDVKSNLGGASGQGVTILP
jgi:DNA-binding beta-propeller fold protein YncE